MRKATCAIHLIAVAISLGMNIGETAAQEISRDLVEELQQQQKRQTVNQHSYSGAAHGEIDWEKGYLVVTAYGAADRSQVQDTAGEKVYAGEVAYRNAIEKAAEVLVGIRVTGQMTVNDFMKLNTTIKQTINGYIQGIEHLAKYDTGETLPDGSWLAQVSAGVQLYGTNGFFFKALGLQPIWDEINKNSFASYQAAPGDHSAAEKEMVYTGLIIDCRKMAAPPTVSAAPRLITPEGKSVYGIENVSRAVISKEGLVRYVVTMDSLVVIEKVGYNPLRIEPLGLKKSANDHIIISPSDAEKIIKADQRYPFLAKARVLVLF